MKYMRLSYIILIIPITFCHSRQLKILTKIIMAVTVVLIILLAVGLAVGLTSGQNESPRSTPEILAEIRRLMDDENIIENNPIEAYIIPSVDAHQSEYLASRDRRIAYVSGFTGSAATVVITKTQALLWTDSRYHIQADQELDSSIWTLMKSGLSNVPSMRDWLVANLPPNSCVGIDPFLMTATEFASLSGTLLSSEHELIGVEKNLVDEIWTDRPAPELGIIEPLERIFSGKSVADKLTDIRAELMRLDAVGHIVSQLDNIAWLLNLRGSDVRNNPVFFSYVVITNDDLYLYVQDTSRITEEITSHFNSEGVTVIVRDYVDLIPGLTGIFATNIGKILLSQSSQAIYATIPAERRLVLDSPIVLMKVVKNPTEVQGLINAHIRDGIAVIRYLHWLEANVDTEYITEVSGSTKLGEFRAEQTNFKSLSFTAISAVGSNAAMAHFRPDEETARQITRNDVYLIDSGGQYKDGTTDITRTIHLGQPSDEIMEAFTRVLKGQISLVTATFPPGAPLSFFDAMARRHLWDIGLNYGHGTGHGIGAYLIVHEYPPSISSQNSGTGILENMFTSNEPGYYKEGDFGIRIENIIRVVKSTKNIRGDFDGSGVLEFSDITMVPIQKKLIKLELMTKSEIDWLNEFHRNILETVSDLLREQDPDAYDWLVQQTEPLPYDLTCSDECNIN